MWSSSGLITIVVKQKLNVVQQIDDLLIGHKLIDYLIYTRLFACPLSLVIGETHRKISSSITGESSMIIISITVNHASYDLVVKRQINEPALHLKTPISTTSLSID